MGIGPEELLGTLLYNLEGIELLIRLKTGVMTSSWIKSV